MMYILPDDKNSAVNRDLRHVTNDWNNSSKYLWSNKITYQNQFSACSMCS